MEINNFKYWISICSAGYRDHTIKFYDQTYCKLVRF